MENVLRLTIDLKTRKMIDKRERLAQRIVPWLIVGPHPLSSLHSPAHRLHVPLFNVKPISWEKSIHFNFFLNKKEETPVTECLKPH